MYKKLSALLKRVEALQKTPFKMAAVDAILLRLRLNTAFEIWEGVDETKLEERYAVLRKAIEALRSEGVTKENAWTWMEEQVVNAEKQYGAAKG